MIKKLQTYLNEKADGIIRTKKQVYLLLVLVIVVISLLGMIFTGGNQGNSGPIPIDEPIIGDDI